MGVKLFYNNNGSKLLVTEVLTNHSMSIDNMLEYVNMDEFAKEQGWDDWDYENLETEV